MFFGLNSELVIISSLESVCWGGLRNSPKTEDGEKNSYTTFCVVVAVVVFVVVPTLATKARKLAPENLVLSPEMFIHDTIDERVDSAT